MNDPITIFHNPDCGTSRNVLAMIRNAGCEPTIVEYLREPPSRERLLGLLGAMEMKPRELLRRRGTPFDELGLGDESLSDEALIDAMLAHPVLIERPIVESRLGTKLCRPSELVLDILPCPQRGAFAKEDGERVVDEKGMRVGRA
jgi:arsenate reductase